MNIRNLFTTLSTMAILFLPLAAFGANDAVPAYQRVALKDGTLLVIEPDGKMRHYDSDGQPMKMAPGTHMVTLDDTIYEMRNNALWQRLWLRGTLRDVR